MKDLRIKTSCFRRCAHNSGVVLTPKKVMFYINGALKGVERVIRYKNRWHGNIVSHYFEVEFCRRDFLNGKTGEG